VRIPDLVQRAQAVTQFLAQTGLPPSLVTSLNFYSPQISLQQTESVSAVWVGKLNSMGVTVFRTKYESAQAPLEGLPNELGFATNNTQTGVSLSYSHRLTGFTNLVASTSYSRATPNGGDDNANSVRSDNFNASVSLNTQFSPRTSGSVGLTYFTFSSPGGSIGDQSTV